MSPLRTLSGLFALAAAATCLAQAPEAAAERRALTAGDLWSVKRPSWLRLSPDGSRLVFAVQEFDLEKNTSVSHLWILETAGGPARRLTSAESSDTDPEWSPDGRRIAFASKRGSDEAPSLYVIPVDGGEAEKILELPLAISAPRWLPDGRRVVVATQVLARFKGDLAATEAELKRQKASKVTAKATENSVYRYFDTWHTDGRATHLMLVDLSTRKAADLTPDWNRAFSFNQEVHYDVSPDGKWIALSAGTTPPPFRGSENLDVYLISVDSPAAPWRNLTSDNLGPDVEPRFTPDGSAVLFGRTLNEADTAENRKLMRVDLATGKVEALFPGLDLSVADWHLSPDGATVYFLAEDRGQTKVFCSRAGAPPTAVAGDGTNSSLAVGAGALYFLRANFSRPDEIYGLDLATGASSVRSHLNDGLFGRLKLGKVEEHTYAGADGDPIELWLIYPPDFDRAKKYPLLVLMHGGPHTMIGDMWQPRWNAQVFVAPGYVAAWMNRHGSSGFGEKFGESIRGAWGEKPFVDIMKGTDYLLDTFPFLDRTRTAALGGSYGGYMACWVCGHTDRFQAIVCHAGALDFTTQFASDVALDWQPYAMAGSPWNRTPEYDRENAINYASHFKTPTLVIHGGMDYRVPVDEGLEFYAALQGQNVPSRLVYFPDENHWVLHPQNSVYWYGEVRDWLARWLK
jgi:dipeptidyl aminopeptidase/acylaminoacyl peptidase